MRMVSGARILNPVQETISGKIEYLRKEIPVKRGSYDAC